MGKAVVCTRTSGQTDVVVDGDNGLYVPPGDPSRCARRSSASSPIRPRPPAWAPTVGAGSS